jgi:hypothetical protein
MAYKGALMIDDRQMIGLMQEVKKQGAMVTVHATNGDVIDYLVAKHRAEGNLSPLYHYRSQPEVTEPKLVAVSPIWPTILAALATLFTYLRGCPKRGSRCDPAQSESIRGDVHSIPGAGCIALREQF